MTARAGRALAGLLAAAALLAGCAGGAPGGGAAGPASGGSLARDFDLGGAPVTVGSKEFTEQLVLGEITVAALQAAGADVTDQVGLAGSAAAREALLAGQIDLYWEYTGTAWVSFLGETEPIGDARAQYEAVAERELAERDLRWLEPAPYDNAYGIAVAADLGRELGVRTLSDYADLVRREPGRAGMCVDAEFLVRDDGLPGLEAAYGFQVPPSDLAIVSIGVLYASIGASDPCPFGVVSQTDGRIAALDLATLEDDLGFFLHYNGAPVVRDEVVREVPDLPAVLAPIAERLDLDTMRALNAEVDVEGRAPGDVAREWLRAEGLIG